ncbi:MAG: hypothetical protein HMLKMBBP_01297 [Planctomycetes bacterium]|nr:hypothetical protein [Planctomycetota bacterium]
MERRCRVCGTPIQPGPGGRYVSCCSAPSVPRRHAPGRDVLDRMDRFLGAVADRLQSNRSSRHAGCGLALCAVLLTLALLLRFAR